MSEFCRLKLTRASSHLFSRARSSARPFFRGWAGAACQLLETLDDDAGKTGKKITKKRVASALVKAGNIKSMSDPDRGPPRPPPVLTYADRDRMAAMSAIPRSSISSKAAVVGGDRPGSDDSDSVLGTGPTRAPGKSNGGSAVASVGGSSDGNGKSSSQGRSSSSSRDRPPPPPSSSSSNGGSSHGKSAHSPHRRSSSGDRRSSSDGQSRPRPPSGPSPGRPTETGKRRRTEDAASNDSASRPRPPPPRPRTPHSGSSKPRPPSTPKPRPPSTPKPPREGGSTPGELRLTKQDGWVP